MYPSNFETERTEQHPKWNKTHTKVPYVAQKSPRQFFLPWRNSPNGPRPPHCRGFMNTLN